MVRGNECIPSPQRLLRSIGRLASHLLFGTLEQYRGVVGTKQNALSFFCMCLPLLHCLGVYIGISRVQLPNCVSFSTICASLVPRIDDMAWHPAFHPTIQRCRSIQYVLVVSKILMFGSMIWRCDHNPLLPCSSFFKHRVNRLPLLSLDFVHQLHYENQVKKS
jgi:hypothetical protein